jgi:HEPN domain-containing protein
LGLSSGLWVLFWFHAFCHRKPDNMDRLSSMGLPNAARKYLDAAEILRQHTKGVCMPAYFVACQGLELTLKACLRGCGLSEKQLRRLGHDLEKITERAFKECPKGLIALSETERVIVSLINMNYQDRDLQLGAREGRSHGSGLRFQTDGR